MSKHHKEFSGLQEWSCGELYPWTVAVRGDGESSRCVPFHCTRGEWGPEFYVNHSGFSAAHRSAEQWISDQLDKEKSLNTIGYRESPSVSGGIPHFDQARLADLGFGVLLGLAAKHNLSADERRALLARYGSPRGEVGSPAVAEVGDSELNYSE